MNPDKIKIKDLNFIQEDSLDDDIMFRAIFQNYSFTVLDRMTGFGHRDTETGLRNRKTKQFYLVSNMFDIRQHPNLTITEAINLIKNKCNN